MVEKHLESKLMHAVKAAGGWAPKFVSPGTAGMPDRIMLFPGGKMAFAEVKAPGKKPRAIQLARLKALAELGFKVFVLDGKEQIPAIIREITA